MDGLRVLLASNFVLYLKTHAAHWNVRGMFFYELHNLFEKQYQELWKQTDTIAEKMHSAKEFAQEMVENGRAEYDELQSMDHTDSKYKQ